MAVNIYRKGRPVRAPYPFDMVWGSPGTGLLLGKPSRGGYPLVISKPQDLTNVAPTDYGYSAQNPIIERVQPIDDLSAGFGLKIQDKFRDMRYYYAINVDCSVGGIWMKGPDIGTVTPSAVNGSVTHFFELSGTLYAANGRYIHKRTSDVDWNTGRVDLGAGLTINDVVTFHSNAAGVSNYAYLAMGDSEFIRRFDGTTATAHASLKARAWAVSGRDLYRAHNTNEMAMVSTDADPWIAANWTAANQFVVGDKSSGIVRIAVSITGAVAVIKTNGVYTLNQAGEYVDLFPHMRFAPSDDNGKGFGYWLNDVYIPHRDGLFRLTPDFRMEGIGPERFTTNDSPVRGQITASAGHDTHNLYAGIYNVDTGNSYLLKFGAWVGGDEGSTLRASRIDAWHGSISEAFTGKKITAMFKSTNGAPSGHARMYLGFSDGSIGWFTLPCTANPAACSEYRFDVSDGELYFPLVHFGFMSDPKSLRAITVTSLHLSTTDFLEFDYRSNVDAAYTDFGNTFTVDPRQRHDFPDNASATMLDLRATFKSGVNTSSPKVTGVGIHHAVRPAALMLFEFLVLCDQGLQKRDGSPYRSGPETIRDLIFDAVGDTGSVTVRFPDESSKEIVVVGYEESQAWDERLKQWRAAIKVKAAELTSNAVYGTVGRLEAYTVGDLSVYTVEQLASL